MRGHHSLKRFKPATEDVAGPFALVSVTKKQFFGSWRLGPRWFVDAALSTKSDWKGRLVGFVFIGQFSRRLAPSCRIVLLKGYDDRGFVFYTNYTSRKASELRDGASAALTFWWPPQERSVRVEGAVARVAPEETAAYFRSRPRASRIGAWASRQSSVVTSAEALTERERALDARFGDDVPVPDFWGGFRLAPARIEFWQGRASRLHDRISFSRQDRRWTRERLAP